MRFAGRERGRADRSTFLREPREGQLPRAASHRRWRPLSLAAVLIAVSACGAPGPEYELEIVSLEGCGTELVAEVKNHGEQTLTLLAAEARIECDKNGFSDETGPLYVPPSGPPSSSLCEARVIAERSSVYLDPASTTTFDVRIETEHEPPYEPARLRLQVEAVAGDGALVSSNVAFAIIQACGSQISDR